MEPEKVSDAELIVRVRSGDATAMGELYARHSDAALRVARATSRDPHLAEDLVSTAFERIQGAIARGAGPADSFRAYLYTVIRRLAAEAGVLRAREQDVDDWSPYESVTALDDDQDRGLEAALVSKAFSSLPERQRAVLWYLEVEGMTPLQAAPLFGLSPNATSALAVRARDALRVAYLQAHVSEHPVHAECGPVRKHMGAYLRATISPRDAAKVEAHLLVCDECPLVLEELKDVGYGLKSVFGPILIGGGVLGGVLAAIGGGGSDGAMAATAGAGLVGAGASAGGSASPGGSSGSGAGQSSQTTWVAAAAIAVLATVGVTTVVSAAVNAAPAAAPMAAEADDASGSPVRAAPVQTPSPSPTPTPQPAPVVPVVPIAEPEPPAAPAPPVVAPPPAATLSLDFTEDQELPDGSWLGRVLVSVTNANAETISARLGVVLPDGVTFDASRPLVGIEAWTCDPFTTTVTCVASSIPAGGSVGLSVPVTIADSAIGSRPIANVSVTRP